MIVYIWHVELNEPPTEERRWTRSLQITVLADTLERACEKSLAKYPGHTLIKVMRDRHAHDLIT